MKGQNLNGIEESVKKKFAKIDKKRKVKMKVSGAGVKTLSRIIGKKS